jgi:hypothetical protein
MRSEGLLGELPDEYVELAKTVREFAVEVVAPVAGRARSG